MDFGTDLTHGMICMNTSMSVSVTYQCLRFFCVPFIFSPFPRMLYAAKRSELLLHWYKSIKLPESSIPIASMYGIFTYIYHTNPPFM